VDCVTYIEKYLSAHVDGELSGDEARAVEKHLAGCGDCRVRYAEERAVKALVRERARRYETPVQVRGSILAALDAVDSGARARNRAGQADRTGTVVMRRPRLWLPVALAAAAVFAFVMLHGGNVPPANAIPAFDSALERYEIFNAHFVPNVPSTSPADISDAYLGHKMPGLLWNLQPSGFRLVGGRLERLDDGSLAAFTFYRGNEGTILCAFMKAHGMQPPPGAIQEVAGHNYYKYKGYSVVLSYYPRGDFISVLVSRKTMPYFIQDILGSSL